MMVPGSSTSATSSKMGVKSSTSSQKEGEEMIVGELSEGVGAAALSKAAAAGMKGRDLDADDDRLDNRPSLFDRDENESGANLPPSVFTYDSSSEDDDELNPTKQRRGQPQQKFGRQRVMLPTCLPFPGTAGRLKQPPHRQEEKKSEETSTKMGNLDIEEDPPIVSPFGDLDLESHKKDSSPMWMLFKFPTRLPRIDPRCTISSGASVKRKPGGGGFRAHVPLSLPDGGTDIAAVTSEEMEGILPIVEGDSADAPPSMSTSANAGTCYDDTLKGISPGKYGKIVVYKSGKTVLVVGPDSNPSQQVSMIVMEGILPGFYQQVVAMDVDEETFTSLGDVQRSVVVIPDVDGAFATN